ncbi:MAG: hypothetical protein IH878_02290 [Gemmatimonadetes bacterium]|nr:hypothetical protein [Gemmatimonadota bacterium]
MAGYCVYAFCALGLAGFVPRPRAGGHPWLGARLFTGFSLIPVFLFLVHIIAGVGLLAAAYALVALAAWQVGQVDRTVVDLATRTFQGLHSRLIRIPPDAARIRAMRGNELPPHPRVALIDQEWPVDAWAIANYYPIGTQYGGPPKDFTVIDRVRWATPAGDERSDVLSDDVLGVLGGADLVWPLGLEDRLRAALAPYIADPECRRRPEAHFLLPKTGARLSFACLPK